MTKIPNNKPVYDLEERTFQFAKAVRLFVKTLPKTTANSKHQIPNKSQIPNTNDLNYFDFSRIDENIFFNSFASCIKSWASLAFFRLFVS